MNGRFLIFSDRCKHSITIKDLDLRDAGEYMVTIKELKSKCNLFVRETEKAPKIDENQIPKYIKLNPNNDVEINIPFEGLLQKTFLI